ncbi:MAG: bifunctional diaminohydroxyphosphoribosylaminopyrimidine deaminase/5-amino-6-(5-phosphoribosylamino)uracil reductase RibD, partial [bacterium]|nr:bifunctional diaminohydroxyphosphoribosylaminopyrimidine deaminase/5-amino-6-(5-phosphoribosylamino)uracil reductase RibD [bacterium]
GKGCSTLRTHGIRVDVGMEEDSARSLNAPYLKFMKSGMPWIIGKWAMSIDGKIATRTGHSQWISGQESRALVHVLRSRMDAIMVGIGTALADDPLLTARGVESRRIPLRIVADSSLRISLECQLVRTAHQLPTLVLAGPNATPEARKQLEARSVQVYISDQTDPVQRLRQFLKYLATERSVTNLLVEGGAALFGSMLEADLLDQIEVFLAPIIIGGVHAPSPVQGLGIENLAQATAFEFHGIQRLGQDIHLSGVRQPKYPS